jgi:hypothetical protein
MEHCVNILKFNEAEEDGIEMFNLRKKEVYYISDEEKDLVQPKLIIKEAVTKINLIFLKKPKRFPV